MCLERSGIPGVSVKEWCSWCVCLKAIGIPGILVCLERSGAPGVSEEVVCDEVEYPIDHL